jgi:Holliday junction resolvase RusA-like endonuclease
MATRTSESVARLASKFRTEFKRLASAGLFAFVLNVDPVPASRPNVGKWGVYYSKTYERFRRAAQQAVAGHKGKPTDGPIIVMIENIVERPKTGKLELPKGDVDNFAKGPLDVMTKAGTFWWDDDQVAALFVSKRYAEPGEAARVIVEWCPLPERT